MNASNLAGGCHCGAVRFTAAIDPDSASFRCNCSICTKSRAWLTTVPMTGFTLDAGSEDLTEYRFGAEIITHCFCRRCGVKTHGRVKGARGQDELIAVSVHCLDLSPDELDAFPRSYVNGLADRQDREPEITGYL